MNNNINYNAKVEMMLSMYTGLVNEIKNLDLDIEELEQNYSGLTAIGYTEKTGETYKISSVVENEIINKENRMEYLQRLKRSKEIQVEKIDNALNVLNDKELKIIQLKYFSDRVKNWTYISNTMNMCEAWCRELKERAIKKMIPVLFIY